MEKSDAKYIAIQLAVKIEDVRFDRRFGIDAERGSDANICNASPPNTVDQCGGCIGAVFRDDAIMRMEISRRKTDALTATIAADNDAFDTIRAAEHSSD